MSVRPASVALWIGILAGPVAWTIVFELKYALIDYVCRNHAHWLYAIFVAGGLLICASGVLVSRRGMAADSSKRARFMGIGGISLSIAFAVFIIAMSIPDLFLRPCE